MCIYIYISIYVYIYTYIYWSQPFPQKPVLIMCTFPYCLAPPLCVMCALMCLAGAERSLYIDSCVCVSLSRLLVRSLYVYVCMCVCVCAFVCVWVWLSRSHSLFLLVAVCVCACMCMYVCPEFGGKKNYKFLGQGLKWNLWSGPVHERSNQPTSQPNFTQLGNVATGVTRFLVVREYDCGNWLARGYMPAHQHCELFYAPAGSSSKLGRLRDSFLCPNRVLTTRLV